MAPERCGNVDEVFRFLAGNSSMTGQGTVGKAMRAS
jgi:hypothetical protein